jgi:hypothetical protein
MPMPKLRQSFISFVPWSLHRRGLAFVAKVGGADTGVGAEAADAADDVVGRRAVEVGFGADCKE